MSETTSAPSTSPPDREIIDRICDGFERTWRAGGRPKIEDYLGHAAASLLEAVLRELIATEIELRRARGDKVSPQEYLARFPNNQAVVERAFAKAPQDPATTAQDSKPSGEASTEGFEPTN